MGMTFFSVGDIVLVPAKVKEININPERTSYYIEPIGSVIIRDPTTLMFTEKDREQILLKYEKGTSNGQD